MKKLSSFVFMILISIPSYAQTVCVDLNDQEYSTVQREAKERNQTIEKPEEYLTADSLAGVFLKNKAEQLAKNHRLRDAESLTEEEIKSAIQLREARV